MRTISNSIKSFYFIIPIYVIIGIFLVNNGLSSNYTMIINPLVWLALLFLSTRLENQKRLKAPLEKAQIVLITIMFYLIIYFSLGMFFGYAKTPYSHEIIPFIKNIWALVLPLIAQEYIRSIMLPSTKLKKYWYVVVILIFSAVEINFYKFNTHFIDLETAFEYSSSVLLPVIARNILLTYIVTISGPLAAWCYRVPLMLANLAMPLFPDLEWFWTALLELLLVIVAYIQINYQHEKSERNYNRGRLKKQSIFAYIPLLAIVTAFVCFVAGVFKYMPVAIMSNSMYDVIERGDAVLVEKLTAKEKQDLKVNDVIEYQLEGSTIIHRIIEIEGEDENKIFITKGDYNSNPDIDPVDLTQVKGKILIKVPKLGYPAVWLSELFNKTKDVGVET